MRDKLKKQGRIRVGTQDIDGKYGFNSEDEENEVEVNQNSDEDDDDDKSDSDKPKSIDKEAQDHVLSIIDRPRKVERVNPLKKKESKPQINEKDVPEYAMKRMSNMSVEENMIAGMGITMRKEPDGEDDGYKSGELNLPNISVNDLNSETPTAR